MEDSLVFFFAAIVFIVSQLVKASKNAKSRQAVDAHRAAAAKPAEKPDEKPKHIYTPMHGTVQPPITMSDVPGQIAIPMMQPAAPKIAPRVHTHLEPDCETHDAPGSMAFVSTEGKDPCHEDQLTYDRSVEEPAPTEGGLSLEWSGENMVKAFVMQEVLARKPLRRVQ